jgi:hypothetical protein
MELDGANLYSDRYARQVVHLLLSIAEKAIGSGVEAASSADPKTPQALFLVELEDGGAISVTEVDANLKVKPVAKFKRVLSKIVAAFRGENREEEDDRQVAPPDNGKKMADGITSNYLDAIRGALEGASRRERENLLTMLILIDESFGMVAEQPPQSSTGGSI